MFQIALVFGIYGACRPDDLVRLRNSDIQKHSDQVMLVNVMKNPKVVERSFVIQDKYIKLVEKYQAVRPPRMERFFVYYRNGKCKKQYIGKNTISFFPKKIAVFLNLPNAQLYSGHCFKHAAALNLSQSCPNPLIVKQSRSWRKNAEAAEYLEESGIMASKKSYTRPLWSNKCDMNLGWIVLSF